MLGWHFLPSTCLLRTGERVKAGGLYTAQGPLELCRNGMHACRRALDALVYAHGPIVCRVRLIGAVQEEFDKAVARSRQVLWLADATALLHEFALSVATDVLELTDCVDQCLRALLVTKSRWLRGQATTRDCRIARDSIKDALVVTGLKRSWPNLSSTGAESVVAAMGGLANPVAWEAAVYTTEEAANVARAIVEAGRASRGAVRARGIEVRAIKASWAAYNAQLEVMLRSLSND